MGISEIPGLGKMAGEDRVRALHEDVGGRRRETPSRDSRWGAPGCPWRVLRFWSTASVSGMARCAKAMAKIKTALNKYFMLSDLRLNFLGEQTCKPFSLSRPALRQVQRSTMWSSSSNCSTRRSSCPTSGLTRLVAPWNEKTSSLTSPLPGNARNRGGLFVGK